MAEDEIRRRLIIYLSIPNEAWTDVFKFFPRSTLVKNISPVSYRFKEICNKNVKTVHVIENAFSFTEKLKKDDPEANMQMEHLAGHKCELAGQFRLTNLHIVKKNKAILRHCIDMFRGCSLSIKPDWDKHMSLILECLNYLESAKPFANIAFAIHIYQKLSRQVISWFLQHPYICNSSSRITLTESTTYSHRIPIKSAGRICSFDVKGDPMSYATTLSDWLHHQPTGVDESDGADEQARCMIIQYHSYNVREVIDWLINNCVQFQEGRCPMDRRRFALSFSHLLEDRSIRLDQFEHQNQKTGEVLLFEHCRYKKSEDEDDEEDDVFPTASCLRRCLVEEVANGKEFCAKMIKKDGPWDDLVVDGETGVYFVADE